MDSEFLVLPLSNADQITPRTQPCEEAKLEDGIEESESKMIISPPTSTDTHTIYCRAGDVETFYNPDHLLAGSEQQASTPEDVHHDSQCVFQENDLVQQTNSDDVILREKQPIEQIYVENHTKEYLSDSNEYSSRSDSFSSNDVSNNDGIDIMMERKIETPLLVNLRAESVDEETGVYDESFRSSKWIFVKDDEISEESTLSSVPEENLESPGDRNTDSGFEQLVNFTPPEVKFRRPYRQVSVTQVHMNNESRSFCRETSAVVSADRLVKLVRTSPEEGFGFSVIGSHPTTISTVTPGSIADRAGLKNGEVILAINFSSVLGKTQQEVVEKLKECGNTIELELCKISSLNKMGQSQDMSSEIYSGFMQKLISPPLLNIWKKRWFVLKADNCLYYYKSQEDKEMLGAIPLSSYTVQRANDLKWPKSHSMKLVHMTKTYYLAVENEEEYAMWAKLLNRATTDTSDMANWLTQSSHNVGLPALSIQNPDCHGFLYKSGGSRQGFKHRYAVLKDGCLYYYIAKESTSAQGVAHLHGYTIDSNPPCTKRHAFFLVPPSSSMRTFKFYVENSVEKERWIKAMKTSIGRWVKIN